MMNRIQVQSLPQKRLRKHISFHPLTITAYAFAEEVVQIILLMYNGTISRLYSNRMGRR